jgi:hypothetical protein
MLYHVQYHHLHQQRKILRCRLYTGLSKASTVSINTNSTKSICGSGGKTSGLKHETTPTSIRIDNMIKNLLFIKQSYKKKEKEEIRFQIPPFYQV